MDKPYMFTLRVFGTIMADDIEDARRRILMEMSQLMWDVDIEELEREDEWDDEDSQ